MCHCHFALPSLFCCRHGLWTWGYPRISLPTQLLAMDAGNPQPGGKAYLGCGRKPGHDSGGRKVAGAALGCPGTFDLLCSGEYLSWASGGLCLSSYLHGDLQSALLVFCSHLRNAGFPWRRLSGPQAIMADSTVLKIPQVRMKVVPMLLLLILSVLRLTTLIESNILASYGFGVLSSWIYLRFYQRHSRGRGDMSDHFAFATFFPEILQPVVGLLANLVHTILVKVKVCRKTVKRYDVGAPSSITISLPGTDPQDAERRRQLALKALNERLKRVEDQSAWPSMEDEDEENTKADTPLLPEKSQDSASVGKASSQESSLITFEDAPSQL
uniref:Transmembrane protein 115 n=1 Tax=Micrurus paraensis TaxID=1970185 RepID=A0A2D4KTK3_9SAUR